jgi:hypothetical protein
MQNDKNPTGYTADSHAWLSHERLYIIDVAFAVDVGTMVRVLNLLAIASAQVVSVASHLDGDRMHLRINARGLDVRQGETLQCRIEAMVGVSHVRVVSGS